MKITCSSFILFIDALVSNKILFKKIYFVTLVKNCFLSFTKVKIHCSYDIISFLNKCNVQKYVI